MRILLLTQFYPPVIGGEERHVRNLGATLAARGHQVSVATQAGLEDAGCAMDGAVRVHRLRGTLQRAGILFSEAERPHAPPIPDPELVLGLRRVIAQEGPEIVHAHNWLLHSYLPLRPFTNALLVVTLHDYSLVCARKDLLHMGQALCSGPALRKCLPCASQHYGGLKGRITTLANWASAAGERRAVDKFLAVSEAVARFNGLPRSGVPYEVVPNFVPDGIGDPGQDAGASPGMPPHDGLARLPEEFMLYVGDLCRQKGVYMLIDAYRGLETEVPLVLIGRGLADFPSEVPPGVRVFGAWPHQAVMQAWERCLFGLAPSISHEACATVVMEAMAFGKPMVVTNLGGMPDLVADEETGLVIPPEISALVQAMRRLLADADLRRRMGQAARGKVAAFRAHAVVSRIEAVYRDLLARRMSLAAE